MNAPRIALWSALSGCVTWLWLAAAPVHAYEDQLSLGLGAGYAYLAHSDAPHHGVAIDLEASLGLAAAWSVRAALGYSLHPGERTSCRLNLSGELVYVVDVLEFVPSLGLGLDALGSHSHGLRDTRVDFGVHPVLGIDWLLRRELMLGLSARPVFVLTDWARQPLYLSVTLSISWLLDL
jgi:hypothetical protein